ncbi:hypothetical protein CY34DRAFT_290459 [Suillus luteus UH-Slu-Lm8-n1]|uniref:Uncharacterized protein n=1 Tax=Suillus luteus UH-Slu-Lm8-n1 TaxID=930992 RepID=A0A0D0AE63_9AGAM|nr:hypothetical protein CY34DRAFT_290459 [Suillus luteus UH-Slu-Lm8-n1]
MERFVIQSTLLNPSYDRVFELNHAALHGAQLYHQAISQSCSPSFSRATKAASAVSVHFKRKTLFEASLMRKWEMHCPAYSTPPHDVPSRGTNKRLHGKHIVRGYLPLLTAYAPLQTEPMKAVVAKYFSWVLSSHGRESKSRCCTILGTKPCTCWKQLAPPRSCRCTKGAWSTRRSRRIQRTGPRWLPSDRKPSHIPYLVFWRPPPRHLWQGDTKRARAILTGDH